MRLSWIAAALAAGLIAGCGKSAIRPSEILDQRTGITVAALDEPIELVQGTQNVAEAMGRHASFAYLGPVEWNRMGSISYGLWIHVAPGDERQVGDIRAPAAVTMNLDGGPLPLAPIEAPPMIRDPYRPVAPWGQTSYFELNADTLKRMAASRKLELEIRAIDDSTMRFMPSRDPQGTLRQYAAARGITGN